jgi:hypothetical protein
VLVQPAAFATIPVDPDPELDIDINLDVPLSVSLSKAGFIPGIHLQSHGILTTRPNL